MSFSLVYLIHQFFFRLYQFVRDWYIGAFLNLGRSAINILESLDRIFAWRITLKNIFQPLYGDHTIIGHSLGFMFRLIRFLIGTVIYTIIIAVAAALYIIWAAVPIFIIYRGFFL